MAILRLLKDAPQSQKEKALAATRPLLNSTNGLERSGAIGVWRALSGAKT